ncbi:hypothetical protein KPH14_005503 [Odynerus spinipes]|uniref:C2H2-type domain-containing protein n=1 Tax=Odynerus spinipes TaxID=1348599 RepID=A0AAD9RBV8_9HYME|nr:hypothetical protein KPH14_005503 [Odynerus spinipes]
MSSSRTNRTCCFCKKLFCCAECCKRHQKNKHPDREFNCPLCCDQKFLLERFVDEKLFCHVVFEHLPLYCCLCGDLFDQSKDLELYGPCKFWSTRRPYVPLSERRSLLATPIASSIETKRKEHSTIDGDYNGNFVGPLTSPPELYRTTSTPMHVSLTSKKSNYDIKTPYVPNFSLKTPNISSATSIKSYASESKNSDSYSKSSSYSTCNSNQDNTPFRSLPSRSSKDEQLSSKSPSTGLMFSVMAEQDETEYVSATRNNIETPTDEMELTGIHGGILPDAPNIKVQVHKERRSSSFKKVRFSDQFECDAESGRVSTGGFNMTENEVYYEARETLSETKDSTTESKEIRMSRSSLKIENVPMGSGNEKTNQPNANNVDENAGESKMRVEATCQSNGSRGNEKNMDKENQCPEGSSHSLVGATQQSGTSRVLMMVVVENNSTVGTSDLGSLIESGLKKLSSVSSIPESNVSGTSRRSITSVDSYVSISSVESYPTSGSTSSCSNLGSQTSLNSNQSNESGGLLSTVTHAVKKALRSFSGGNYSRPISGQRMFKREELSSSSSFGNPLSSFSSCLSSNSSRKRSRDFNDGFPCATSTANDPKILQTDDRSPMAKRHRGWHKIKGREPIARMKNQLTSPRGISSETQVFSQGALSVRNTIIPIPARAHQSTQTESMSNN